MGHQMGTITMGMEAGSSVLMSHHAPKLMPIPRMVPPTPMIKASARTIRKMKALDPPSDFRMPISRVRCNTAIYMERHITAKPMMTPIETITHTNSLSPGMLLTLNRAINSAMEYNLYTPQPGSFLRLAMTASVLAGSSSLR